jgi:hypothetical protein
MEILSYILSAIGFAAVVTASLLKGKKMKQILFLVFCGNFLYATSYLVGGSGLNGAASCYLGGVTAIINYFYDAKGKPIPKWLTALYAAAFILVNLWVGGFNLLVLLAIVATLCFVLCIGQANGKRFRFWTAFNLVLWCVYDVLTASYGTLLAHIGQLAFTVLGMVLHDRKQRSGS